MRSRGNDPLYLHMHWSGTFTQSALGQEPLSAGLGKPEYSGFRSLVACVSVELDQMGFEVDMQDLYAKCL